MSPTPGAVLNGIALLDSGRFHAAHAAFERAWREAQGCERRLWQAMVQIAAAVHHAERGRMRPAIALLRRARRHLVGLRPGTGGIDVSGLRTAAARTEERLLELQGSGRGWCSGWAPRIELSSPPP